jgi:hypothetical protein
MVQAQQFVLKTESFVRVFGDGPDFWIYSRSSVGVLWIRDRIDCVSRPCKVRSEKFLKLRVLLAHLVSQVVG